jgi:hypothetical protein
VERSLASGGVQPHSLLQQITSMISNALRGGQGQHCLPEACLISRVCACQKVRLLFLRRSDCYLSCCSFGLTARLVLQCQAPRDRLAPMPPVTIALYTRDQGALQAVMVPLECRHCGARHYHSFW